MGGKEWNVYRGPNGRGADVRSEMQSQDTKEEECEMSNKDRLSEYGEPENTDRRNRRI